MVSSIESKEKSRTRLRLAVYFKQKGANISGDVFGEISIILAIGTVIAFVVHLLKQPLIIGHIITGILVGPTFMNLIHSEDTVDVFAKIGITLLLFIVGLGLNPRVIKEVGRVSILTGVGQVLFTVLISLGILNLLGYESVESLYIAIALAFSSTIIILKLLTDKKEQGRLYGKISIGFLLVQDIIATIALVVASALNKGADGTAVDPVTLAINGVLLFSGIWLFSSKILPTFTRVVAGSQEFLFLFALGWGLGIATLFARAGFSIEVGALFAGVALASSLYAQEVAAKLRPLRDFFIVLFFISLGAGLNLTSVGEVLPHGILLSLIVLVGNPIIVFTIMNLLNFTKKTSFKAGLTVAQISEFSIVFILLGRDLGSISDKVVSLVTVVALITIAVSAYMIIYADKLYAWLEKYLTLVERKSSKRSDRDHNRKVDIVLFGYKRGGEEFLKSFAPLSKNTLVVDYDPTVVEIMDRSNVPYLYGDAMDIELLDEAGVDNAKLVVSTLSDQTTNLFLVNQLSRMNPNATLIFQAENPKDAMDLYNEGATYVMMPHLLGSEKIGSFIKRNGFTRSAFKQWRVKHLDALEKQSARQALASEAIETSGDEPIAKI